MQFRIPQFLDIEDKVFGPFTFKQFGYLLGAIAFAYIFWKLIPFKVLSIPFILIFSGTFLALAFVKINNRPFADILEAGYKYVIGGKTFVWQKRKEEVKPEEKREVRAINIIKRDRNGAEIKDNTEDKTVTLEKLKELSSKLDILDEEKKGRINLREELLKRNGKYQI